MDHSLCLKQRLILSVILLFSAVGGAALAAPFQNLDFTETTLDPNAFGQLPYSSDFSVVAPRWQLLIENAEGTVSVPHEEHGFFADDFTTTNIGTQGDVALFAKTPVPTEPFAVPDFLLYLLNSFDPPEWQSSPVISQTSEVPSSTKSIRIVIRQGATPAFISMFTNMGEPVVRFDGHEVVLVEVPADSGDGAVDGIVYAGNIEPVAGLTRTMRIGPGSNVGNPIEDGGEPRGTLIDNIVFSSLTAPGPPVEVPEPTTFALALAALCLAMGRLHSHLECPVKTLSCFVSSLR